MDFYLHNFSTTQNETLYYNSELEEKLHRPYVIFYLALTGVMAAIGVAGNLLTIATFTLTPSLHQIWNAFVVNLAVADLLVTGIVMPYSMFGVIAGKRYFDERPILCKFLATVCAPGCLASMYTICWISCTRYFFICNYSKFLAYFTKRNTGLFIASIWFLCFLVHSPNHFGWGDSKYSIGFQLCTLDTENLSYSLFYGCCMFSAFVITFVFYFKTYQTVRNSNLAKKMITNKNPGDRDSLISDEIKLAKTSFKIFIIFVTFWSPTAVLILTGGEVVVPSAVYLYCVLMAHSNSTLNFFIYYIDNKCFRQGCKQLFNQVKKKRQSVIGISIN